MAKLDTLTLRVTNPDAQRHFYCDVLGMNNQGGGRVGYSPQETAIHFTKAAAPYSPQPSDLYWKIALSVPNIDLAFEQLQKRGAACTQPNQFLDIGFLAHVTDPEGFTVELIDHFFQGDRPDTPLDARALGGGAHLSLVTLRTADIGAIEPAVLGWGMSPLSVQPVEAHDFTLYFYAFTDERPPDPDLKAIANRPWLYRRPYSVLEIQHKHNLRKEHTSPAQEGCGYGGLTIRTGGTAASFARLGVAEAVL